LLTGLNAIQRKGFGLPLHLTPSIEYPLEESYIQIAQLIGMDWVK